MKYQLLSKYRSELMGIAMLAVILFHASELDLGPVFGSVRPMLFGGVDVFVLLSAMGIAMSICRQARPYGAYCIRRLRRILPAYYLVMLPFTLYLYLTKEAQISAFFWNATLLQYWVRPQGRFNWYVTAIVTYYAFLPALVAALARSRRPVLTVALGWLASFGVCELLYRDGYWYYMDIFFRVPVVLQGALAGIWIVRGRELLRRDVFAGCLMLLGGGLAVMARYLDITEWGAYAFPFLALPACVVAAAVMDRFPLRPLLAALRSLGEHSLEIYLLNVSVFDLYGTLSAALRLEGPAYYAVTVPLNILLAYPLHWLVGRAVDLPGRRRGQSA